MKSSTKILSALLVIAVTQLPAQSVPEYVNYQGLLKAANGSPLTTGTYTLEFNIYDQANAGTKVWGPFIFDGSPGNGHGALVPVVNGSFNVIIGPRDTTGASIASAFADPNRFIEIKVNGGAPILPRQQFLSTAYALQSQSAQSAALAQMAVQASNLVQQAADALCPPGSIMAFGGSVVPDGWLLCDGRPLTNTIFPRLFAAIGTNWGNGSVDSNGVAENPPNPETGFNLPDLRGMFLRGVNGSRTNPATMDPDRATRTTWTAGNTGDAVGSVQADNFKTHDHVMHGKGAVVNAGWLSHNDPNGWFSGNGNARFGVTGSIDTAMRTGDAPESLAEGKETRPRNAYVNYIIKY